MAYQKFIIGILIFAILVIPLVQLSFGFHYVNDGDSCPIERDIMLLMAIGGVFELIFFAASLGFLYEITPSKYKAQKTKTVAQQSAQGSNRASLILTGCITGIFGACAIAFFVLIQIQVYRNFQNVQTTNSSLSTYCLFTIYSSAFGLMIATYVAFILLFMVAIILLCGFCTNQTSS